jgi:tRNA(Ile)-lysidine synthetase-like protein
MLFSPNIDRRVVVACSGGPDSMALLHFCRVGRKDITVLHFQHGESDFSKLSRCLVEDYCSDHELPLCVTKLPYGTEAEWHDMRSQYYQMSEAQVVTGHTLDDAIEWYLITAFKGNPSYTPVVNGKVFRPMLNTNRSSIRDYADRNKVPYLVDPTNIGKFNDRAKLRTHLPALLGDFPYLRGTLKNYYNDRFAELSTQC